MFIYFKDFIFCNPKQGEFFFNDHINGFKMLHSIQSTKISAQH